VAAPLLNTYPREKFGTLGLGNLKAINLSCSLVVQLSGYPQIWKAKEGQEKNKKGKRRRERVSQLHATAFKQDCQLQNFTQESSINCFFSFI
jgi:hypothetical protein